MAASRNKLTAKQAASYKGPGRLSDGGNLFLRVRPSGHRTWCFLYEKQVIDPATGQPRRKQVEIALGTYGDAYDGGLTLAAAREKAAPHRRALEDGLDPLEVMRAAEAARTAAETTFAAYVAKFLERRRPEWSNPKHAKQWETTLGAPYCKSLQARPIASIDVKDVLEVLTPVWSRLPETARRIRMRLEAVFDAARVEGLRSGENPARWRGHLDHLLPRHKPDQKGHHTALPFEQVPALMAELRTRPATAARALQFLITTACRTSEVLHAQWSEIDLKNKLWTIPKERMKSRRAHRVPLSEAALEVLDAVKGRHERYLFPGPSGKGPLSNMALLMLLERLGLRDATTAHGLRSSFRDWTSEKTTFSGEVAEQALAHVVANETERAYRRGDLFEKRKQLMEAWGRFCTAAPANVVQLRRG